MAELPILLDEQVREEVVDARVEANFVHETKTCRGDLIV